MTLYVYPPVSLDKTGLATEAKQDDIIAALGDAATEVTLAAVLAAIQAPTGIERTLANAPYTRDYSSSSISDAAWTEIVAATTLKTRKLHIFDSSGELVRLAIGSAGAEVEVFRIEPGGPGPVELTIPAGTRVSIRAVSGTISVGNLNINFLT